MLTLLITLDCVRDDHVGTGLTPNLDALAPTWTTFTQAFAQSQNTLSSHLSMLTSNYLFQHGVYSNYVHKSLPPHALTRRLNQEGWETRAFTSIDFLALLLGNHVGEADPRFPMTADRSLKARVRRRFHGRRASAEKTLRAALRWLGLPSRGRDVFLWVHLFDAHMPYEAPSHYLRRHVPYQKAGTPLREQIARRGWFSPDFPEYGWRVPLENFPQRYRAAVSYIDACLGRFFGQLQAYNWWEDALVFVTADHGECLLGDHGVYCAHKKLFDTTVKVPLRVKFPRGKFAGDRVDAIVQHVDIAPTVAAQAGFEEPLYMGHDLRKVAWGRAHGHPVAFAEHVDNFLRAVRDRDYLYVERVPGSENKWNLAMEPGDFFTRDAAPAPLEAAAEASRLKRQMEDVLTSRPDVQEAWGTGASADSEVAERLKELGYM